MAKRTLDLGEVEKEDLTPSAERVLSCTFICGPALVFSSISKGMKKLATEFLLTSPSSPALSLLSCVRNRVRVDGLLVWSSLAHGAGSPHSVVKTAAFALVLGVLAHY